MSFMHSPSELYCKLNWSEVQVGWMVFTATLGRGLMFVALFKALPSLLKSASDKVLTERFWLLT